MILDGHNDLALRVFLGQEPRHIDLATAVESGFMGGFFALSSPQASAALPSGGAYSLPLDEPIGHTEARQAVDGLLGTLESLELTVVTRSSEILPGRVNAIVHFEGAEPIAPDLSDLDDWVARGLRSVGITWSRANAFAEGVPFRFPSTPDTGPGLTAAGFDLLHACNFHGLLVDVSHLNEAGFWDVVRASQAPVVATHSNAHALSPSSRNLTDRQLDAIADSGGVVGVNFAPMFLTEDGDWDVGLDAIVGHVDYIASRVGVDHVAFGSDFEGAPMPAELEGVSGLPRLVEAIAATGYDEAAIAKITHGNWLRVLDDVWKPWSRYYRRAGLDARPTLLEAASRFSEPGLAVDLGAGTGRDTLELLRRGWRVVAIDGEPEAVNKIVQLAGADASRLEAVVGRYEATPWSQCDLLNASYAIPFCPPGQFPEVWGRIVGSIVAGGRFAGQFFGPNDDWARTGLLIHSRAEVERLLDGFELESLHEEDADGTTTVGKTKHWHLFHVVARKR